jgi:hypothetical protein
VKRERKKDKNSFEDRIDETSQITLKHYSHAQDGQLSEIKREKKIKLPRET